MRASRVRLPLRRSARLVGPYCSNSARNVPCGFASATVTGFCHKTVSADARLAPGLLPHHPIFVLAPE